MSGVAMFNLAGAICSLMLSIGAFRKHKFETGFAWITAAFGMFGIVGYSW